MGDQEAQPKQICGRRAPLAGVNNPAGPHQRPFRFTFAVSSGCVGAAAATGAGTPAQPGSTPPSDKEAEAGNETREACVDGRRASCLQTPPAWIHPGAQRAARASQAPLNPPEDSYKQHVCTYKIFSSLRREKLPK